MRAGIAGLLGTQQLPLARRLGVPPEPPKQHRRDATGRAYCPRTRSSGARGRQGVWIHLRPRLFRRDRNLPQRPSPHCRRRRRARACLPFGHRRQNLRSEDRSRRRARVDSRARWPGRALDPRRQDLDRARDTACTLEQARDTERALDILRLLDHGRDPSEQRRHRHQVGLVVFAHARHRLLGLNTLRVLDRAPEHGRDRVPRNIADTTHTQLGPLERDQAAVRRVVSPQAAGRI